MKLFLCLILFFSFNLFAINPNFYSCKSQNQEKNFEINYTTENMAGVSNLQVNENSWYGNKIQKKNVELGTLVTTMKENSDHLSLVVPSINLSTIGSRITFNTILIYTIHYVSIEQADALLTRSTFIPVICYATYHLN